MLSVSFCQVSVILIILYTVSQKRGNILFVLCWSNINRLQSKIEHILEETTKLCKNCPPNLKYVLALILGKLKWPIEPWTYILYVYILINHLIATNTTGSYCLKNCQKCSTSHHFYIICSRCLPPAHVGATLQWTVWFRLFTRLWYA